MIGHESWVRGMAFVGDPLAGVAELGGMGTPACRTIHSLAGFGSATIKPPKPNAFLMISGDYHGKLIWWQADTETPKPIRTIEAHRGWARAVAVSPDKQIVASCGNDNAVRLWKASDGTALRVLEGHASHVYNIAFHPSGTHLASCDLKGNVKDWNLQTGICERDLDAKVLHKYDPGFMADIGGARAMEFSSDGTKLACAGITNVSNAFAGVGNPAVVLFDWKRGEIETAQDKKKDFRVLPGESPFTPQALLSQVEEETVVPSGFGKAMILPVVLLALTVAASARDSISLARW